MPRGIERGRTRASGSTVANEVAAAQGEDMERPPEEQLPEERARVFDFPGFSRMRTEWEGDDRHVLQRIRASVDRRVFDVYADAYLVMEDLYALVREPEVDERTGAVATDEFGLTRWRRSPNGSYLEDWSRLGMRQRDDFLFRITTSLFEWELRRDDLWGEAMFSKARWIERFAHEFEAPRAGTVEDRTQRANAEAAEDRYFALYLTWLSRKADSVVRSMERLQLRLKDTLPR